MSTFTVLNPATEETVATVPSTSAEETDAAIARAVAAQAAWRAVAPGERAALLRAFADAVDAHNEELAGLEVAGSGHPVGQARWEAGNVPDVLRYYSAAPERLFGKQIPVPGGVNVTFQDPVGVVGLIVPWNFPMPILGWGLGPALAAGHPVIAKPAERTPLTAIRIRELAREVAVGAPPTPTPEMAPPPRPAPGPRSASSAPPAPRVASRAHAPAGPGYWFAPTVLAPVRPDYPAYTDEVFGPVVAVVPFEDEADAVKIANDTPYGLSGSIWTQNLGRALRVARAVETGKLSVNSHSSVRYWTPFGGFKQSGLGRELGPDALDAFTETKNVFIATEE